MLGALCGAALGVGYKLIGDQAYSITRDAWVMNMLIVLNRP